MPSAASSPRARHDAPEPIPIPVDLPPGTTASLVEPDDIVPAAPERTRLEQPIIYRCIHHPNLKIVGRYVLRPHPQAPDKLVRYRMPTLKFWETWLRVEYEDENEIIQRRMTRDQIFVEPQDESLQRMEYRTDEGRVIFSTRSPTLYLAFERRMRS